MGKPHWLLLATALLLAPVTSAQGGDLASMMKMVGQMLKAGDATGDMLERFAPDAQASSPAAAPELPGGIDLERVLNQAGLDPQSLEQKLGQLNAALGGGSGAGGGGSSSALPISLPAILGNSEAAGSCPAGQLCGRTAATAAAASGPGPKTIANPYVSPGKAAGKLPQIILGPLK